MSLCVSVVKTTNSWSLSVHAIAFHWSNTRRFDYAMDSSHENTEYDSNVFSGHSMMTEYKTSPLFTDN